MRILRPIYSAMSLVAFLLTGSSPAAPFAVKVGIGAIDGALQDSVIAKRNDGLICGRQGDKLLLKSSATSLETLDMGAVARAAIERDVLRGKWDGGWDRSLMVDNTIRFDAAGRAYTLIIPRLSNLKFAVLLWSKDGCRNWKALALAARNATMEKADGFNDKNSPPTVISFERYGPYAGSRLWLNAFVFDNNEVRPASSMPLLVADNSLLVANHSGGGNSTFTTPKRVVVAYPTTDSSRGGTELMTRELDRSKGQWIGPARILGRSTSSTGGPDNHDLAAVAMLPSGHLLAVIGAHHARFKVFESRGPGTTLNGWGNPTLLGDDKQNQFSYASLNVSRTGFVNVIARSEWRQGYYDLVQFRRNPNGRWQNWPQGVAARIIVAPNRHAYVAWRHRVTMDPTGALYLSFAFYANRMTDLEARDAGLSDRDRGECSVGRCWYNNAPTLEGGGMISEDDGATWH